MNMYNVKPEFKTRVSEIFSTQKFSAVFPFMNLVNRESFTYSENELNSIVQAIGELPYAQVAEFFQQLPSLVSLVETVSAADSTPTTASAENAPQVTEPTLFEAVD